MRTFFFLATGLCLCGSLASAGDDTVAPIASQTAKALRRNQRISSKHEFAQFWLNIASGVTVRGSRSRGYDSTRGRGCSKGLIPVRWWCRASPRRAL